MVPFQSLYRGHLFHLWSLKLYLFSSSSPLPPLETNGFGRVFGEILDIFRSMFYAVIFPIIFTVVKVTIDTVFVVSAFLWLRNVTSHWRSHICLCFYNLPWCSHLKINTLTS